MTGRANVWLPLTLGAGAFALFAATAAPTFTFWDGAHYPLLAATLSISNPPGSLLLTVIGWAWTRVVWCPSVAFQLNLLAAGFAACTVGLIAAVSLRVATRTEEARPRAWLAGFAAAGWLGSSYHLWTYATQFTPYGLTAAFTALLLFLFLRWWERAEEHDDLPGLALFAIVMGLDVSVHRTNQLLLPAALAGVWLRRPRLLVEPRAWALALLAYVTGVGSQVGYLVLSARRPFLDIDEMRSLADVWHYIRLDALGGGFLVDVWPRRGDFWRVQLADWLAFLWRSMGTTSVTRGVALALAFAGLGQLTRRSRRVALYLLASFASAGLGAVIFFNRPEHYMRPLDRHYMPSLVVLAVFVGAGASGLTILAQRLRPRLVRLVPVVGSVVLVAANALGNLADCDRSHTRYAERWARDLLEPLPARAILFTNGDNDTFPLWYLQQVERVRPDVLVLNLPVLCLPRTVRELARLEPEFRSVQAGVHAMRDIILANAGRRPVYAAVTVSADWEPDMRRLAILEGLSYRLYTEGDTPVSGPELERFVVDRLPKLGLNDRRQLLEPDLTQLIANYSFAALRLASQQLAHGEYARGLETLRSAEAQIPSARLGETGRSMESAIANMRRAAIEAERPGANRPRK